VTIIWEEQCTFKRSTEVRSRSNRTCWKTQVKADERKIGWIGRKDATAYAI